MRLKLTTLILIFCSVFANLSAQETINVNSLEALQPYLKGSNQHIVVAPGTYKVTVKDIKAKKYIAQAEVVLGRITRALMLVEGDNNVIDFSGVTVEVETKVANAFPDPFSEFQNIHILGSNNTIKGLKLVDVGSVNDAPRRGWLNVLIDGANNVVDGIEVHSRGSVPYGYGEVFGKGGKNTIRHHKHSAVLIRGDFNTLRNARVIHRSYGHFIFMQAAKNPTVEGCYVEGEMVTTDDILKEKGTGSAADKINFKTAFGYTLPKGYTLSTGEDGIRTYDAGQTMVNGERFKRGTVNPTVRNCTVKHARGGVALTLSRGTKIIDNVTLIGCQGSFATGTGGRITNCRADATFGPVFANAYERDRNIEVDITIIPYEGETYVGNGAKCAAIILGSGHNITLRRGEGLKEDTKLEICVGGVRRGIGQLAENKDLTASNIILRNETKYPVVLGSQTTGITGATAGKIVDKGTNNSMVKK